ncbi:mitochondrial inner membrane protease subunit 1-like protein, partial [Trifolium pratense]
AYGPSMLPTLNIAGDVVLVEHLSPRIGKVGYGDLVLVRSPLNPNRNLTKRVVAMEGDTVTYFDPLNSDSSRNAVINEYEQGFLVDRRMTGYWKLTHKVEGLGSNHGHGVRPNNFGIYASLARICGHYMSKGFVPTS